MKEEDVDYTFDVLDKLEKQLWSAHKKCGNLAYLTSDNENIHSFFMSSQTILRNLIFYVNGCIMDIQKEIADEKANANS